MSTNRIIDQNEQGKALLTQYQKDVETLYGMVQEFKENKALYLSPVIRELLFDHADKVQQQHIKLKHHLCIDWIERKDA